MLRLRKIALCAQALLRSGQQNVEGCEIPPSENPRECSGLDFVQRRHSGQHVFIDVAVIHPYAGIVGNHSDWSLIG
jgi:hypothetical protein